jgi:hypothetical protein
MHVRQSALPLMVFLAGALAVAQPACAAGDPPQGETQ